MWTALLGTEVVDLESLPASDKLALRTDGSAVFACRGCGGRVHTRRIPTGSAWTDETDPFIVFCHNPGEAERCRALGLGYDESPEHHRLKSRLARAGRRAGWKVELEVQPDRTCRADVLATRKDGKQWVLEAQLAGLSLPNAVERQDRYTKAFGNCTWVHTGKREWASRIPALQISDAERAVVIAGVKTDPTGAYDAEPELIDSVVPRVLSNSLTHVYLEDFGFYVDLTAQPSARARGVSAVSAGTAGRYVKEICDRPKVKAETRHVPSPFETELAAATSDQRRALLEGRARMAKARMAAGLPLDDSDIEALDTVEAD